MSMSEELRPSIDAMNDDDDVNVNVDVDVDVDDTGDAGGLMIAASVHLQRDAAEPSPLLMGVLYHPN